MRYLFLIVFILTGLNHRAFAFGPFLEGSIGVNALTDVSEGGRSESGVGMNLNGKGGLMVGSFFGGLDLNLSVIETGESYFGSVEENSLGVVGGIDLVGFSRLYLSLFPHSALEHDNGKYKGVGYKFGAAFYLPFIPFANLLIELRNITYDKKKISGKYRSTPDLDVTSLCFSFGVFFN